MRTNERVRWVIGLAMAGWLSGLAVAGPVLRVAAASSLADVLREVGSDFTRVTGVKVELVVGGSNGLARQILAGAPADVFFCADAAKMDDLEKAGLLEPGTREDQLSNRLAVVVPAGSGLRISSLSDVALPVVGRISMGDPKAVPVGVYARQRLEKLGVWERVRPKVVAVENARAALAAVESGNVDAGIVYRTDARMSKKVKVAIEVAETEGLPIVYPMAVLKAAKDVVAARRFLDHIDSVASRGMFEKAGFIVLPEADGSR